MRKGFLIYEEMRKYLVIYEEAVSHSFPTTPFWISLFMRTKFFLVFISVLVFNICKELKQRKAKLNQHGILARYGILF